MENRMNRIQVGVDLGGGEGGGEAGFNDFGWI